MNEDLVAKYGRRKNSQNDGNIENNEASYSSSKYEDKEKYGINNTFTKKAQADKSELAKEKEIKTNIKDVVSKYSAKNQNLSTSTTHDGKIKYRQENKFVKILKAFLIFCILSTVACIIISFIAKPQINTESEQIIDKIKKAEELYYAKVKKYHYFSRTDYDYTLGIDLNKYKYFTSYEVIRDEKTGNYATKVYGATNAFTITYFVIKSWIMNK